MSEQAQEDSDAVRPAEPVRTDPTGPSNECPPGYVFIGGECVEAGGFRNRGR